MRFTERDFKILGYLSEQGVATLEQIRLEYFENAGTCSKRISMLSRQGYIESIRLTDFAKESKTRFKGIREDFFPTTSDFWKVKLYRLGTKIVARNAVHLEITEPVYFHHQLSLNEVRRVVTSVLPKDGIFLSDPETRRKYSSMSSGLDGVIPDLIWKKDEVSFAFELERSEKSDLRLFQRFQSYRSSQYKKVLYFCANDKIFDRILKFTERLPILGVSRLSEPLKVYDNRFNVTHISEFLGVTK